MYYEFEFQEKNIRNHAYEIALKRQTEFVLIDIICH